ncbi:penicillin-binding protein 1C [Cypionkella sp.]|uniref:penicillin-binding protein 1C n=1 Tax=Cypionkella sp. TaxID=2811411 RepID=UPI00275D0241|nr:penicillin-binding protein 1C [Cypionkella sp.]
MMRGAAVFALAAGLFLAGLGRDLADQWIDTTDLPSLSLQSSVEVVDRRGALLRVYTVADGRWRLGLRLADVDPAFVAALLSYEDKRFYQHSGVDTRAMLRALAQAVWQGHVSSGGSTITMQVARLLEASGTGHWAGKLRQIRLALALERRLSKAEILTLYLKLAPYGGNLEGLRAATLAYFGKEPLRLTPAQIALLVAIPQSPEARRPDRAVAAATDARDRVLARARRDGLIDNDQLRAARSEVVPAARRSFPALAPHMADRVLAETPSPSRHQLTLDKTLQIKLEQLAREVVAAQGARLQVALVVADHASGEILASVGSAAFQADQRAGFVDMTRAIRSPGSTLKPLIYGMAFDEGLAHPETLIEDQPSDFNGYRPQNFDRHYRGTIRIREALQQSLNIPVVALAEAMGPAKLLARLDQAGVPYALPNGTAGLAIALGGIGLRLEDMVQLYAMIARGGVSLPLIHKAQAQNPQGQRVLSEAAAWQIGDILAGLAPPPGAPANRLAYKTGTSYGHRDAWAIGYDGRHVIGVWMGRPDGTPVPGAFGADLAAPVLFQAFARLKPTLTPQPPAPPATLLVSTLDLPQPLRHFRSRSAAFDAPADTPAVAFPPDGAEVELLPDGVLARVSGGTPPFTWLANGAPVVVAERARAVMLGDLGRGFVTLSVIDAEGRSARSQVRLR